MAEYTTKEKRALNEGKKVKGKTILQCRSRTWHFTIHNPTSEDLDRLRANNMPESGVIGIEMGESGETPHLQGFWRFKDAKTGSAVQKMTGCGKHRVELPIADDYGNWNYCMKEGNVLQQWGEMPQESTKSKHSDWVFAYEQIKHNKGIMSVIDSKPHMARYISGMRGIQEEFDLKNNNGWRTLDVTYINGPAGTGKSRFVDAKHGSENVYRVTNKRNPWDGYRGEPVVIFEEYRSNYGIENMLNWLDGYRLMLPCRYMNRPAQFTTVYLITNIPFAEQFEAHQMNHPETFVAFCRRVHRVVSYTEVVGPEGSDLGAWRKMSMDEYLDNYMREYVDEFRKQKQATLEGFSLDDIL